MYKPFYIDNKVFLVKKKSPRLGYACILMSEKIPVNRTCIQSTFISKGVDYAIGLAICNLNNVLKILEWNEKNNIKFYRMSSDMLPHMTNPKVIPSGKKYAYSIEQFQPICFKIGQYAKKHGHRLTFHPGQYCQVGTPRKEVFDKTIVDLSMHADLLDMMELDGNSVMIVHGGGVFGDKEETIKRWIKQFFLLPLNVQNRLVIENCERAYSVFDMLYISSKISRPVVFDTHHHDCYSKLITPQPCPSQFLGQVLQTWRCKGLRPKFHVSNQDPEKRVGAHSKYVEYIPWYLDNLDVDIMIEAKCKELAVLMLI